MSINSVRHRVLRNALAKIAPKVERHEWDLPTLEPGQMQLYSYFTPGLSTGLYDIIAEQTITPSGQGSKVVKADPQSFLVDAPTFSIDPGLIHSTYPPEGVAAQTNILPHVVFNDPHLPWQTEVGKTSEKDTMRIPWLAVVAFEQSELQIPPGDPLFPSGLQGESQPSQTFTMATRLRVEQFTNSGLQCALPDLGTSLQEDSTLSTKSVDVIFPEMSLFSALFVDSTDGEPTINLDRYKYLAHVRQVNTDHMTEAGNLEGGQFSIVFSHRTGPPFAKDDAPHPKRCVAHVVSLDWVHRIPSSAIKTNKRAALISLYSWTYDCPPPTTINFRDVMRAVGKNNEVFGTPKAIWGTAGADLSADVCSRLQDRMKDGYTLIRYKVQTGEDTVAFMRGPLTPQPNPDADWFDVHTNTGEDLQILDAVLGIMDISYCAAWQLGKSLAIADQSFCAALLRIRASVYDASTEKAKEDTLATKFKRATSNRVIKALPDHFDKMTQLGKDKPDDTRWDRPSLIQSRYELLADSADSEDYTNDKEGHIRRLMEAQASADDGTHHTEFKNPASTDWDQVLNWVMNKLYLEKIPPWYLIPDPTWLPSESIRFFHVDRKWLSALVDGALSVANHLDVHDIARQAIKDQLVRYLNSEIHSVLQHPPQIPSYGFFLRSVAVVAFPDMVVRAPWPKTSKGETDPRAEVLRQQNVRKDIMFVLLDRTPRDLQQLIISQPPHQQCFTFGQDDTFSADGFRFGLRKVYGTPTLDKHMDGFEVVDYARDSNGLCDIYDWNSRTIRLDNLTTLVGKTLEKAHESDPDIYNKEVNAALMGIELNDPIYRLTFTPGTGAASFRLSAPSAKFALPGGASAAVPSRPPTPMDFDRPFKKNAVMRKIPKRPPGSSKVPPPLVSSSFVARPIGVPLRNRLVGQVKEKPPLSTETDPRFEDTEPCDARFTPRCFALGDKSLGKTDDISLPSSGPISLVIALTRNETDFDSDDFIRAFEISIPFGIGPEAVLLEPAKSDKLVLLNTVRCKPYVVGEDDGDYPYKILPGKSDSQQCFVIRLEPKAVSLQTPLSHNKDMSLVIRGARVNSWATDAMISVLEWYISQEGNTRYAEYTISPIRAQPT